jgi:hypothetical protein
MKAARDGVGRQLVGLLRFQETTADRTALSPSAHCTTTALLVLVLLQRAVGG